MLEVRDLKKRFGTNVAVDGVSFTVDRGTCFGLLGPNGAGKSTTISILVGALRADAGTVLIDGAPIRSETDPVRRRIGYVPQEIALYEDLSALDNLRFFGALYGDVDGARIDDALEIVGLTERAKEPVRAFSGGMKRRLNIAAALVHEPDILVLDEPTVGVDPQSRNAIFDSLVALQRKGLTLLYITHYMEEVERLCDRIAIIDHGKIIADDTLDGLLAGLPGRASVKLTFSSEADAIEATSAIEEQAMLAVVQSSNTAMFAPSDLSRDLSRALAVLDDRKLVVTAVTTDRPNLEEVFLALTGRGLRDA